MDAKIDYKNLQFTSSDDTTQENASGSCQNDKKHHQYENISLFEKTQDSKLSESYQTQQFTVTLYPVSSQDKNFAESRDTY